MGNRSAILGAGSHNESCWTKNELSQFNASLKHQIGTIDINKEHGKVEPGYMDNLQRDLDLVYQPEH